MPGRENWVWDAVLSPGSGPEGSGQPVRSIWTDFQPQPLILDPVRAKFDVFGPEQTLVGTCQALLLLRSLAAGAFFSVKMAIQNLTSPALLGSLAAGAFFSVKMATQGLTSLIL